MASLPRERKMKLALDWATQWEGSLRMRLVKESFFRLQAVTNDLPKIAVDALSFRHFKRLNESAKVLVLKRVSRLASNPLRRQLLGQLGGMEAVIHVLKENSTEELVCFSAMQTLHSMAVGDTCNCAKMVAFSPGGMDTVLAILARSSSSQDARMLASEILLCLVTNSQDALRAMVVSNGIKTLVYAFRKHIVSSAIMINIIAIARTLMSANEQSRSILIEEGVLEKIMHVVATPTSKDLFLHVCGLLTQLLLNHSVNQRCAKRAGVEEVLIEAQRTATPDDAKLAVDAALEVLKSGEQYERFMLADPFAQDRHSSCKIKNTALRAISLQQLLDLGAFAKETLDKYDIVDRNSMSPDQGCSLMWETMSMYQMCNFFVMPLTSFARTSYVETVAVAEQAPMWMLSHWWGTPFSTTSKLLSLHARSRYRRTSAEVTYWCCTMANNQRDLDELKEENLLESPFARAMFSKECTGTVLVCDPKVTPLTRIWCVFEAYITSQLKLRNSESTSVFARANKIAYLLDVAAPRRTGNDDVVGTLLQDAVGGCWHEISESPGVLFPLEVAHLGVNVDVSKAQASVQSDKFSILNFISTGHATKDVPASDHPSYRHLNAFVHRTFASAELYRLAAERPANCSEAIERLLLLRSDPNRFVRGGNTPLLAALGADGGAASKAIDAGQQQEIVEMLLDSRANVNHGNSEMNTALDVLHKGKAESESLKKLLLDHGAKSWPEVAPELESKINSEIKNLISIGFKTEWSSFCGGTAGTSLAKPAEQCLQLVAAALRLYSQARVPCEIILCANEGTRQHHLAADRARAVQEYLESAGCTLDFVSSCIPQQEILKLRISLSSQGDSFDSPQVLPAAKSDTHHALGRSNQNSIREHIPIAFAKSLGEPLQMKAIAKSSSSRSSYFGQNVQLNSSLGSASDRSPSRASPLGGARSPCRSPCTTLDNSRLGPLVFCPRGSGLGSSSPSSPGNTSACETAATSSLLFQIGRSRGMPSAVRSTPVIAQLSHSASLSTLPAQRMSGAIVAPNAGDASPVMMTRTAGALSNSLPNLHGRANRRSSF